MGANLVELYTHLEEKLRKETAKVLVEAIGELTEEKRNSLKFELKEELLKWLIVLFVGQATFIVGLIPTF